MKRRFQAFGTINAVVTLQPINKARLVRSVVPLAVVTTLWPTCSSITLVVAFAAPPHKSAARMQLIHTALLFTLSLLKC